MKNTIKSLTSVELFAGIGGFRVACEAFGIKTIWANDLDDKACKIYATKFGEDELMKGDIKQLYDSIPKHDLLTGGFPCQPFSSAGKKMGTLDPRGTLFESIVHILKEHKPKYFILENVKRLLEMEDGKNFATILTALSDLDYLIEWRLVNAKYFGLPQNRPRIIITGRFRNGEKPGKYSKLLSNDEVDVIKSGLGLFGNRAWKKFSDHSISFPNWGMAFNGHFIATDVIGFSESLPEKKLIDVLQEKAGQNFDFTEDTMKRIENSIFVNKYVNGVQILYNQKGGARMGYTIFGSEGIAPTLTCTTSRHYERYKVDGHYRRLTNVEYARIQGFSDDHCSAVSVYDQYKYYGNAVPPNIIKWAIEKLIKKEGVEINLLN